MLSPMRFVNALVRMAVASVGIYATVNFIRDSPDVWWTTFTAQANVMAAAVMLWAAWALLAQRPTPPAWLQGAVTLYLGITAIVYALVLGYPDSPQPHVLVMFTNTELHHAVTPVGTAVIWILFVEHRRLRWRWAGLWLVYLLAYLGAVLLRGALDPSSGYPYSFVDPTALGWGGLGVSVLKYAAAFWVMGLALIAVDRMLPRRTPLTEPLRGESAGRESGVDSGTGVVGHSHVDAV